MILLEKDWLSDSSITNIDHTEVFRGSSIYRYFGTRQLSYKPQSILLGKRFTQSEEKHGGVNYNIMYGVNNIGMTRHGVRRVLDLLGDHFVSYINV